MPADDDTVLAVTRHLKEGCMSSNFTVRFTAKNKIYGADSRS